MEEAEVEGRGGAEASEGEVDEEEGDQGRAREEVEPGEDIYFDWIKTVGCNIVTNEYFGNSKK